MKLPSVQYPRSQPPKLIASTVTGPGAELFIVEGDSACASVASVRDSRLQAVLPMQGKPLNAWRATKERVLNFPLYQALADVLGVAPRDTEAPPVDPGLFDDCAAPGDSTGAWRYPRVLLLFDPDADGIHSGALMLMYFYRWQRELLEQGRVEMVRAPMFEVRYVDANSDRMERPVHATSEPHLQRMVARLREQGAQQIETHRHRGLGGIEPDLLRVHCVDPRTRLTSVMTPSDAQAAIRVFSGGGI